MREVILETHEGWRKTVVMPDDVPVARMPFMSDRHKDSLDYSCASRYYYMDFEWDGELDQQPDGTGIEVWKER
jgi:hypothetical protein